MLTWEICTTRVFADERSFLDGGHSQRSSDGQLRINSLFWIGPVTNKELQEEVTHNHVCVLSEPVSLRNCELCVVLRRSIGQSDRIALQ